MRIILISTVFFTSFHNIITERAQPEVRVCQNQNLLLGSEKNMAKLTDVTSGTIIRLECNFCDTKDSFQAKLWYYKKRGEERESYEIVFDMENNPTSQRLSLTPAHTLIISNFTINDAGIYTCKIQNHDKDNIFTYVVDEIFAESSKPKIGKVSEWDEYKRLYFNPINNHFDKLEEFPYTQLRNFNFTFKIMTLWENWGKCEVCGRKKGIRRKIGKCRLYPIPHNRTYENSNFNETEKNISDYYIKDDYHIACSSVHLNLTFPDLSTFIKTIPDFEATESCDGLCIPVIEGGVTGSKKNYKYKMTKHIAENSHITLSCPEVSLESTVEWFKDKKLLNDSFRIRFPISLHQTNLRIHSSQHLALFGNNMAVFSEEPHLSIDAYNSLYILHATKKEEAVYTCHVDGAKMQNFDIRVVSKSKVLNQEFIRYSIYLGFVLSLTLTCYCAGMFVAWRRRTSFADPLFLVTNREFQDSQEMQQLIN